MRTTSASLLCRLIGAVLLVAATACGPGSTSTDETSGGGSGFSPEGRAAAEHFLSTYVTDDGRVLRHDQGDDVVSEGQAYGMLIAELVGADATVREVWSWTRQHLRRPDDLLSFHADSSGTVTDPESATDADILAAYALLRYDGADATAIHHDGDRLAAAVLAHETTRSASGDLVPVAGSWVRGEPWVNPSYWMPGVAAELADITGDDRWEGMARTTLSLLDRLTEDGRRLPPDWARLDGDTVRAAGAPDGSHPVQYGPDAQRVPLFVAGSCKVHGAEELAAAWWRLLGAADRSTALALDLDGTVVDGTKAPLALLAAAATARAAGDRDRGAELVGVATEQTRTTPTYYGDAWLALAAGLAEHRLGGC